MLPFFQWDHDIFPVSTLYSPLSHLVSLIILGFLFPFHNPRLHNEEHRGHVHHDHAHKSHTKTPGQEVVFPVRHEVPAVTLCPEDDEGDCSTTSTNYQINSDPTKDLDPVIVVDAEKIHDHHGDGHQHPHETYREEELCGDEERFDELVSNDVVFFQQYMATTVEFHFIFMSLVVKTIEAGVPKAKVGEFGLF